MKKSITTLVLVLVAVILSAVAIFALDSNGVWTRAEDIRSGTFGADEGAGTYHFNDVNMDNIAVKTIKSSDATGNVVIQLGP